MLMALLLTLLTAFPKSTPNFLSKQPSQSQSYISQVPINTAEPKRWLPYSHEQKHVLLFGKWEILHFKVSMPNMPHFFRSKTFLFVKNKDRKLKFSEVSQNPKSKHCWKFQLSILTNKKIVFLKKCGILYTNISKISDFLNSNTCFCYGIQKLKLILNFRVKWAIWP